MFITSSDMAGINIVEEAHINRDISLISAASNIQSPIPIYF